MSRILETTQETINELLENIGVDVAHNEWVNLNHLLSSYIPQFIGRGGKCSNALEDLDTLPPHLHPSNMQYPIPAMKVEYGGSWICITRAGCRQHIRLTVFKADIPMWDSFVVPIQHLDVVLCHMLELPHKKP